MFYGKWLIVNEAIKTRWIFC